MDIVIDLFRFLHFLGLALLLGGLLVDLKSLQRNVRPAVAAGAVLQLVSGLALFGLLVTDIDHLKATVKLVLLAVACVLVFLARRRGFSARSFGSVTSLTAVITAIAVFW